MYFTKILYIIRIQESTGKGKRIDVNKTFVDKNSHLIPISYFLGIYKSLPIHIYLSTAVIRVVLAVEAVIPRIKTHI